MRSIMQFFSITQKNHALLAEVGRVVSEDVKTKRENQFFHTPRLTMCPLTEADLQSLDFIVNHFLHDELYKIQSQIIF